MQTRVKLAGGLESNVRIINGLIGRREGIGKIVEDDVHPMNTIMRENFYGVPVKYVDLNSIMKVGEKIYLLKCDIEGAELQFLENYADLLGNVEAAVFELHPKICDSKKCIGLLKGAKLLQCDVLRQTEDFMVAYFRRQGDFSQNYLC